VFFTGAVIPDRFPVSRVKHSCTGRLGAVSVSRARRIVAQVDLLCVWARDARQLAVKVVGIVGSHRRRAYVGSR